MLLRALMVMVEAAAASRVRNHSLDSQGTVASYEKRWLLGRVESISWAPISLFMNSSLSWIVKRIFGAQCLPQFCSLSNFPRGRFWSEKHQTSSLFKLNEKNNIQEDHHISFIYYAKRNIVIFLYIILSIQLE